MSQRPEQTESLWHPAENAAEWRKLSKPTVQRRRVRLRPTLPDGLPQQAEQAGAWHLPDLTETTARPAPTTGRPEAIALGLTEAEVTPVAAPPEADTADAESPQRPEDLSMGETGDAENSPERPEDAAFALTETAAPEDGEAAPEDVDVDDNDYDKALAELDDDDDAFTMGELLALQQLADESTGDNVSQGESLEMDVEAAAALVDDLDPGSLSPAERAALGLEASTSEGSTEEAEVMPDTAPADQFDYSSVLAGLEGGGDQQQPAEATGGAASGQPATADQFDYSSVLAGLQDSDDDQQQPAAQENDPFGETQTYQDTPSAAAEPVDPEREAFAQQFKATEQQVRDLREQRDDKMISPEQFESALRELMIYDPYDRVYWMMGADTEIWYKYDQTAGQWLVAEPPETAADQQRREQNVMTPDTGMRQVGDLENAVPRVREQDDWGYSQQVDAAPNFEETDYQAPGQAAPQDANYTVVGDAAFKDELDYVQPTVVGQGAVAASEAVVEPAPDYESEVGEDLSSEIELARRRRNRQLTTTITAVVGVITGLILLTAAGMVFYVYSSYQDIKNNWDGGIAAFGNFETDFQTVVIEDINGNEIARLRSEQGGDRTNVNLQNVSPEMIHAVVSTENERFFTDAGWDPIAIARAFLQNLTAGEVVSGGSTITQQLARNIVLRENIGEFSTEAQRKLNEIVISHELAQRYSKERILEVYLNEVFFGNQNYGVEAAAEFYFDKTASNLNLAEAAMLAGLIQAPAAYDPVTNPGAAFDRLDEVVRLMREAGGNGCLPIPFQPGSFCVTQATLEGEAAIHIAEVKTTVYLPERTIIDYPHFVTFVQQQLQTQFSQEEIFRRGFVVRTTLRPEIQDNAQDSLSRYVDSISTTGVNTGTVMVTNPDTGAILALVGSPDFNDETIDGQVNLALSWQQPGSAIKPITYARALGGVQTASGTSYYTPATILWDVPTTYGDAANTTITNFDNEYHGPQSVRQALQRSYNVPAVKTYAFIGNEAFRAMAEAMGLRFLPEATFNLTTALGSTEVRLYDMMEAYATLSNDGVLVPLYAIEQITDSTGNPVTWTRDEPTRALQETTAYLMQDILSDDQSRQAEFGANNRLSFNGFPGQVAAKTGTSNDGRDLWTLGFTDDVVVGVWLGHVDNNPTFNTSGYQTASPLWRNVMDNVLSNTRPPSPWNVPTNIIEAQYCATTGTLADNSGQLPCNDVRTGRFISGQLPPASTDGFVQQVEVYAWTGELANDFCPNDRQTVTVANISDPTAIAWLRDNPQGQQFARNLGFTGGIRTIPQQSCGPETQLLMAGITQPQSGAVVTTPQIQVLGNITSAANFSSYDLQVASANTPDQFRIVAGPFNSRPTNNQLGVWDAGTSSDGQYILRLAINSTNGNTVYRETAFTLDTPDPTPTPTPLPIPTAPPINGGGVGITNPGIATPTLLPFDSGFGTQGLNPLPPTTDFGG